jgi:hypothetical protein
MNIDVTQMDKLRTLRKSDLQDILAKYKLRKSGNKPELFGRLFNFYNENPEIPIDTPPEHRKKSGRPRKHKINAVDNVTKHQNYILPRNSKHSLHCNTYLCKHDVNHLIYIIEQMDFSPVISSILNDTVIETIINTYKYYKLTYNPGLKYSKVHAKPTILVSYDTRQQLYELRHLFDIIDVVTTNPAPIIKIQKYHRRYVIRQFNRLHGPAIVRRSLCKNTEDFITYEQIKYIHPNEFYSFKDTTDGHIYGFRIKSLIEYIKCNEMYAGSKKNMINPYNNMPIPDNRIEHIKKVYELLLKYGIIHPSVPPKMTKEQQMTDFAIRIFNRIDNLGNYTDVNWFLDLNINQLKVLYREAEDIWNYRALHLTPEIKKKHIPNNDAFKIKPHRVNAMINKLKVQNIILEQFYKFITEGETAEECKTGALWMLMAMVKVSSAQAESMGWLIQ